MNIYIATSFHDKDRAESVARMLREEGHTITCEWWFSKSPVVAEAEKDLSGIKVCDVVLGLFEKPFIYKGAIFELGVAQALNKQIIIVGNQLDSMVFMLLSNITKVKDIAKALKLLRAQEIKQDNPV